MPMVFVWCLSRGGGEFEVDSDMYRKNTHRMRYWFSTAKKATRTLHGVTLNVSCPSLCNTVLLVFLWLLCLLHILPFSYRLYSARL
jgi:hypothetical protein